MEDKILNSIRYIKDNFKVIWDGQSPPFPEDHSFKFENEDDVLNFCKFLIKKQCPFIYVQNCIINIPYEFLSYILQDCVDSFYKKIDEW